MNVSNQHFIRYLKNSGDYTMMFISHKILIRLLIILENDLFIQCILCLFLWYKSPLLYVILLRDHLSLTFFYTTAQRHIHTFFLSVCLVLSLSLSLSHTHTHYLSVCVSHRHTLSVCVCLSLSLSLSHTHTISVCVSLSLSHTQSLSLILSVRISPLSF